jgi:hypothetical protein
MSRAFATRARHATNLGHQKFGGLLFPAMINPLEWKYAAQAGLLVSAIVGTGFGVVIAYQSGNGWLGTFIWALTGTVILGGAFYLDRVAR